MALPILRLLFERDTRGWQWLRELDNHYHLQTIAEGTDDLISYQQELLKRQAQAAGLIVSSIADQTGILSRMAGEMLSQKQILQEIAKAVQRPYETKMLELRLEAQKWADNGRKRLGQESLDDFNDALRLFGEVVKNPIGNQDRVAWFEIGWLLWKIEQNYPEAESAFYRAARLSENPSDAYYRLGVRHQAYMFYLQGRPFDAYECIQKVIPAVESHDAPYDAARYAACLGQTNEAIKLLQQAIARNPAVYVAMISEPDFQSSMEIMKLADSERDEARERLRQAKLRITKLQEEMNDWHVHEYAADAEHRALTLLQQSTDAENRSGFLDLVQAEQLAQTCAATCLDSIVQARGKIEAIIATEFAWLSQRHYSILNKIARHAPVEFERVRHAMWPAQTSPKSYSEFQEAQKQLADAKTLLDKAEIAAERPYRKEQLKKEITVAVVGLFGGWFIGFFLCAVGVIVFGADKDNPTIRTIGEFIIAICALIGFALGWVFPEMFKLTIRL